MLESGWKTCHATPSLQRSVPDALAHEQRAVVLSDDEDGLLIAIAATSEREPHATLGVMDGHGGWETVDAVPATRASQGGTPPLGLEQRRCALSNGTGRP